MKKELEKQIQASARVVEAWRALVDGNGPLPNERLRPAFIANRLACALTDVEDLLAVHSTLWPENTRWRQLNGEPSLKGFAGEMNFLRSGIEVSQEDQTEWLPTQAQDPRELYAFFCQIRQSIKFYSALTGNSRNRDFEHSVSDALASIREMSRSQKYALEVALTGLITNSFLFLDARLPNGGSIGERYSPLFRAVRQLRGEINMNIDQIRQILNESQIKLETRSRVEELIDALRRLLSDYDIDQICDILSDGGHSIRGIGNGGDIVVIPSNGRGYCAPVVLAIAQGRDGRSRYGLPKVMREVRAHLIECFEIAEVVILLTDRWDPDLMKESLPDFEAYASRAGRNKVLIPIVSWKRQLTTYEWP